MIKQILEKSNKQIYEQSDRVRSFQSKLLLSDALQEREEQIEVKKKIQEIEKLRERQQQELEQEILRRKEEEHERQLELQREKKLTTALVLKEQHDEMKRNYIKRIQ